MGERIMNIPISGVECLFYMVCITGALLVIALLGVAVCEFFEKKGD
jgi:hypothetical protein